MSEDALERPIRVLLVDDHEVVRQGTRELLEKAGFAVVGEAQDGQEAVEQVRRLSPDVVLMDAAMPRVNGVDATRAIKVVAPATAVLALSAYDDDQYVYALLEAGAAGYLLKNVRGPQLIEAVRAVRNGESVLHPQVAARVLNRVAGHAAPTPPAVEDPLTPRELEVLRMASKGLSNKEIAARLVISTRTVQVHLANIFHKLKVGSRTEAVLHALRAGLVTLADTRPDDD